MDWILHGARGEHLALSSCSRITQEHRTHVGTDHPAVVAGGIGDRKLYTCLGVEIPPTGPGWSSWASYTASQTVLLRGLLKGRCI